MESQMLKVIRKVSIEYGKTTHPGVELECSNCGEIQEATEAQLWDKKLTRGTMLDVNCEGCNLAPEDDKELIAHVRAAQDALIEGYGETH
jgi:ribosomal protein S27E